MLIEFSVENHRVFRERQTFSMVASRPMAKRDKPGRVTQTGSSAVPGLLRSACLFGANGAGKSSLINAMLFMLNFVRGSFRNEPGGGTATQPFAFHSQWCDKPSVFEVIFLHDGVLYQYGFALTVKRVVEEWLFSRPNSTGRQRQIFARYYDEEKEAYDWSISSLYLKGERESWKEQTREDALFLSTAVHLNSEDLKGVYYWFDNQLKIMHKDHLPPYTASRFDEDGWSQKVVNFLKRADIALVDIDVKEHSLFEAPTFQEAPAEIRKMMKERIPVDAIQLTVYTVRQNEKGERVPLNLEEESTGTISLFNLAGPILDVLDNGYILVVDELNSGLHPLAFRHLISLFYDPEMNKKNAQLIFTTHDVSVTEHECMGRDQIWLVEKGKDLAAKLVPYSDFKTRDERSFRKGYLQGRYGAIPRIAG